MPDTRKLLLVDDEEGIRRVLALVLQDADWTVHTATGGLEALESMREHPVPIVLTDIKMPGMDGLELLAAIKAAHPDTEVVLMTGHGDMDLAIQGIKHDAADFVTKPINDDVLEIALRRAHERWSMRQSIREHTEHLQHLVDQKTRELLDAARFATIGQTVATLSHSIKNMASGLEGSLFLLRQGLDSNRQDYLEQGWDMLDANVRRLKELSMSMLRFNQTDELTLAPTDPVAPARAVVELMQRRALRHGITLLLDAPDTLPTMLLDEPAVHRCLLDLVSNAIDACVSAGFDALTPGGEVTLSVQNTPSNLSYAIHDNGCGIADDIRSRLFQPFFTTKGDNGSGLGLMYVRKTMQTLGGHIEVLPRKHTGTTVSINIPH